MHLKQNAEEMPSDVWRAFDGGQNALRSEGKLKSVIHAYVFNDFILVKQIRKYNYKCKISDSFIFKQVW